MSTDVTADEQPQPETWWEAFEEAEYQKSLALTVDEMRRRLNAGMLESEAIRMMCVALSEGWRSLASAGVTLPEGDLSLWEIAAMVGVSDHMEPSEAYRRTAEWIEWRAGLGQAERRASEPADPRLPASRRRKKGELDEAALRYLLDHKEATKRQVAAAIGCNERTLNRDCPRFMRALATLKAAKSRFPRADEVR